MEVKNVTIDTEAIKYILTLRYLPSENPQFLKLTWKDFIEQPISNPIDFVENSLKNNIQEKIQVLKTNKVSIALSGGIDSTLTLALLRELFPELKIEAISAKFTESADESEDASIIADHFNVSHSVIHIENLYKSLR